MTAREMWARWKAISNRIVANPRYRYPAPALLLNLVHFAQEEMGHWNTVHWGGASSVMSGGRKYRAWRRAHA